MVDVYLFIYTFLKSLCALFSRVDKFLRHSTPIQVSPTIVDSHVDTHLLIFETKQLSVVCVRASARVSGRERDKIREDRKGTEAIFTYKYTLLYKWWLMCR